MGLERDGRLKIVKSRKKEGGTTIQRKRHRLQHEVSGCVGKRRDEAITERNVVEGTPGVSVKGKLKR